jgi:hypothetical protein
MKKTALKITPKFCAGGQHINRPLQTTLQRWIALTILLLAFAPGVWAQTVVTLTTNSTSPWTVPAGVTSVTVQMWGGGGGGGGQDYTPTKEGGGGGGGGGGGYSTATISVTPGSTITFTVGGAGTPGAATGTAGGAGGTTTFGSVTAADGGTGGGGANDTTVNGSAGAAGSGGTYNGGNGAAGITGTGGGGGGGGAGTSQNGNNATGDTGGTAVTGGGAGANGQTTSDSPGISGGSPGGGGSGAYEKSTGTGGNIGGMGGPGQIVLTYTATAAATPLVETAPTASAITYGQALSASILSGGACTNNAGAALPGSFTFTTPATTPGAGTPSESVTFTPNDTNDYDVIYFNISVTVHQATPLLETTPTASTLYNGQPLSDLILSGGACTNAAGTALPGSFAFTTPSATPGLGTANQSVTFTPADATDYSTVNLNVSVTVAQFVTTTLTTNNPTAWTVPAGVTNIEVELWGGGGGGGGALNNNTASGGGGGGGGASTVISSLSVTPLSVINITVGASGPGGANGNPGANGTTGGTTTFAGTYSATGGTGGSGATTGTTGGAGGAGGAGSFTGGTGVAGSGGGAYGGAGGGSGGTAANGNTGSEFTAGVAVTGGGAGGNGSDASGVGGTAGNAPGGGGGGSYEKGTTIMDGGAGAAGQIVISNLSSAVVLPPRPVITSIGLSGANLLLNGTNGTAGTCYLLMSTNAALSLASWTPVSTNVLAASGPFSFIATNAVSPNSPQQFYILQIP